MPNPFLDLHNDTRNTRTTKTRHDYRVAARTLAEAFVVTNTGDELFAVLRYANKIGNVAHKNVARFLDGCYFADYSAHFDFDALKAFAWAYIDAHE